MSARSVSENEATSPPPSPSDEEIEAVATVLIRSDDDGAAGFDDSWTWYRSVAKNALEAAAKVRPENRSDEILERTAQELYGLDAKRNGRPAQWNKHNEHFQNEWRKRADVFLAAIGVT